MSETHRSHEVFNSYDDYEPLWLILCCAYDRAATGKGAERHANSRPLNEQPLLTITRAVGMGFPLGQALKKIEESTRLPTEGAVEELLDAIVYLAAAVIVHGDTDDFTSLT